MSIASNPSPVLKTALALFWILAGGALAAASSTLRFDNDHWLPPDHPQERALDLLAERFQPGEGLVLAIDFRAEGGALSEKSLAEIRALEKSLEEKLGADLISIRSFLSAQRISSHDDVIEVETFDDALKRGAFRDMEHFREVFDKSPYGGRLLSKDAMIGALRLRVETREQSERRREMMERLETHLLASPISQNPYHLIGPAPLKDALNKKSFSELPRLLLFALLVLGVFLILSLGSLARALPILLLAAFSSMSLFAVMSFLGHPMTVISLALPALLSVIAVADALHILAQYDDLAQKGDVSLRDMLRACGKRILLPCFLTSFTSAVGFGAFYVSELIPLTHFGLQSFVAILLVYPLALLLSTSVLFLFPQHIAKRAQRRDWGLAAFLERCHRWTTRRPLWVVGAFLTLTLGLSAGLFHIKTETNFLEVFFKESSRIRQDFLIADKKLGGSGSVDILLRATNAKDRFHALDALSRIAPIEASLKAHQDVLHLESYRTPLRETHEALTGGAGFPEEANLLAQELLFLELSRNENRDDVLSPYADFTYSSARLSLSTPDLSSNRLDAMLTDLQSRLRPLKGNWEAVWTGFGVFIHQLSTYVFTTQLESFVITIGFIGIVFFVSFGMMQGVMALFVNILPVGATTGLIAWMGVPFDFATVLIAGITLGLCVDDTIHFLHNHNRERLGGASAQEARRQRTFPFGAPDRDDQPSLLAGLRDASHFGSGCAAALCAFHDHGPSLGALRVGLASASPFGAPPLGAPPLGALVFPFPSRSISFR